MLETLVVTENEYRKGEETFRRCSSFRTVRSPDDEASLASVVQNENARAVIVGVGRYTGPLYSALQIGGQKQGSLIIRFGVGHDGVNKALARQAGIAVCNTPGTLDISVAEHVLWLMGCLARRIPQAEAALRAGNFQCAAGSELSGKRLGIVGFGRIGRRVARIAHYGFGMKVWAANSTGVARLEQVEKCSLAEIRQRYGLERYVERIEELMAECDYVTIHLPSNVSTRQFINAPTLALMKPAACLINTARGGVLDEAALYDALAEGRIGGAALDVFECEPYQPSPGKDLRQLDNVVLTPHIGSNTQEANQRMAAACLTNAQHFFAGQLDQLTRVDLPELPP
ncbi:MAG TPA: NAD(P)-dependent oxidoreductase [Verrucomicrobiae bacterium]|nr:NAD(P)-dependent oxidoreductase [Verrucomicrobiae bacterium]